jgi:hypothetical protein
MNFFGIHYGQNTFSTHMYNFWSGFGSDITEFAIIGTLISIYRHHVKGMRELNLKKLIEDEEAKKRPKETNSKGS